jgi:hypothetical protein
MAKGKDKNSLAEDYIAHVEWDNRHPLDRRGRPSWRHQPKWKYDRILSHIDKNKIPVIGWVIIFIITITCIGFLVFITNSAFPGAGIVGILTLLAIPIILYVITRKSKS